MGQNCVNVGLGVLAVQGMEKSSCGSIPPYPLTPQSQNAGGYVDQKLPRVLLDSQPT